MFLDNFSVISSFKVSTSSFLLVLDNSFLHRDFFFHAVDPKMSVLLVSTCFDSQYHTFSAYVPPLLIKISIDSFLLEADSSFLLLVKLVFCVGFGIVIGQKSRKHCSCGHILIFQLKLRESYCFEFYQALNSQIYTFRC